MSEDMEVRGASIANKAKLYFTSIPRRSVTSIQLRTNRITVLD